MSKVLIIDDHPVIQVGLASLIRKNDLFNVVDIASTGKEAVKKIRALSDKNRYDMYIVDINLPDYDIFSLIETIKMLNPNSPILIFSVNPPHIYINKLTKIGIDGYLNKTMPKEKIIDAIQTLKKGKKYFSQDALDVIIDIQSQKKSKYNNIENLSQRELEIMLLLIDGRSISSISGTLNLNKSSVATYKSRIFQKMMVKNIIELYKMVKENRLQDENNL